MKSINFVVLGEQSIASDFGKKGTITDLTLFDRKESDVIKTWVLPNGFTEKIQPLFQAINLAEYVILYVASLDKFVGEQMVALDILKKRFARGEIDKDEFEERRRVLEGMGHRLRARGGAPGHADHDSVDAE